MTQEAPQPSAGWYDHPSMVDTLRYWDGRAWTSHIQANVQRRKSVRAAWEGLGILAALFVPPIGFVLGIYLIVRNGSKTGYAIVAISLLTLAFVWGNAVANFVRAPIL